MELVFLYFSSMFIGFSGALVPGPLLSVNVRETLKRGISAGPLLISGHALLELGITLALVFGLSVFLVSPVVSGTFGLLGAVVLVWMGYGMLREARQKNLELEMGGEEKGSALGPVATGALVSLLNPYFTLWWGTVGAGYVVISLQYGMAGIIFFYLGHISADFIWYTLVSWLLVRGSSKFSPNLYRAITGVCGIFLMAMAIYFFYSGLTFF
ncbi:LysE family transporter [Candidatus Contubernalis alkaliaceticus]|uniref:LysE family transporter n=1 Tax=Candidatus Contubernalis alkaliaceticus TaxID=338645 RepID=UPI001F4BEB11|nr:LysE family transporter [Candidatus Contubernalis alkalaceticus]UNC91512.1 LysE family transporter [Candidatus Contubernalis alkalaceticus]